MRRIVLTFGFIAGAILSVTMLATLPFHDRIGFGWVGLVVGYASMVLAFLMVFAGVRSYRDNVAGGSVTFGRALTVGLSIMAIASICYVATWEVVYYEVTPDFMDKYAAYTIDQAKQAGATEARIAELSKEMSEFKEAYRNPLVNIAYTLVEPLPVGLLFAFAAAWVHSRKRRAGSATAAGV